MRRIIMASITAVVVIAVLAGTLIPVLDDATTTSDTFTNTGLWRMDELKAGDTWTRNGSTGEWSYNGSSVLESSNTVSSVVLGDTWTVRGNGQIRADTYGSNLGNPTITVNDDETVTLVNVSMSGIDGYGIKSDGSCIMTQYQNPVYVNGDSRIYATGATAPTGGSMFISHIEGTINDGITITCMDANNDGTNFVVSNSKINYTAVDGYIDLYKLESITWDLTYDFTDTVGFETSVSYSSYVVPYEVTAERSVHFTDGENAIFNAIPAMVIIALLLAVVALVLRSRMD